MVEPPKSVFEQFAPWVAIGVSFIWNWVNYRRTSDLRAMGIHVDEFRRLRTSVDAILTDFRAQLATLEGMAALGSKASRKETLEKLNSDFSEINTRMTILLEQMDQSTYARGKNWLPSYEFDFDEFISKFQTLYAPDNAASSVNSRSEACLKAARTLLSNLNSKLEQNMIHLTDNPYRWLFWRNTK